MKNLFRDNGLSIVLFILFILSLLGQIFTGVHEHNEEVVKEGGMAVSIGEYLTTGHFLQSTFENWESEFCRWLYL